MMRPFLSLAIGLPMALTARYCTHIFAPVQDWFFWGTITGYMVLAFINKVYEQ